jgi:spore coat protein A, manganese oxidase
MRPAVKEIIPGLPTTVWGYNGSFPGPTILARRGRSVAIRQQNNLKVETSVHLHGGHTPAASDGYPLDMIMPGEHKDYLYPNDQLPATLWYHDHVMDFTGRNVYNGLAGCYILSDDYEDSLPLPSGRYDVPLIIQDRLFNPDGSLAYSLVANGLFGDTILVNGNVQPFFHVERRKYRFRILNGSNARRYELALSNKQPFIQIGSDGGLLSAPVGRTSVTLAPAERVDLVIDFARVSGGTDIVLNNLLGFGSTGQVMQFRVKSQKYGKWDTDPSSIPSSFREVVPIPPASASVNRTFTLHGAAGRFTINDQEFDPKRIDAEPQLGATEIWTFDNHHALPHPMHVHNISWQILDINGMPPQPWDAGWKDTFNVAANQSVRVIGKFIDYTGLYVFHCHNLEHEDLGMMAQFRVN